MESSEVKVAIIGAGISGLGLAYKLVTAGFTEFTIFEAQNYPGGRIKSLSFDGSFLELGAQWIHGQDDNILYEFADSNDLLSQIESVEGDGRFCTSDGSLIDQNFVSQALMFLDNVKLALLKPNFTQLLQIPECSSVAEVFYISFKNWLDLEKFDCDSRKLLWAIFRWFMTFETIDNSCLSMDQLSALSYTTYRQCDGNPLNNLKNGYSSLIYKLLEHIPANNLKLNTPIKSIRLGQSNNQVILTTEDNQNLCYNHVIITCSLGFLKCNLNLFLGPLISPEKTHIIQSLGFGTVNKIYMIFDEPFWGLNDLGFQLVWSEEKNTSYPSWVYDISGIDTVKQQPKVLVAWIGGKGAETVEGESDDVIIDTLHRILKQFLENCLQKSILRPKKIIKTSWFSNRYIKGSYSNKTRAFEESQTTLDALILPIFRTCIYNNKKISWPLVFFAGEATSENFFSTTHGALESGYREAERLLNFWTKNRLLTSLINRDHS